MSKLSEEVQLNVPQAQAQQACSDAISKLGWKSETSGSAIVAKPGMGLTKWPSKLTIGVADAGGSASTVTIDGSIWGFGPVQKGHLRKDIEAFRGALQPSTATAPEATSTT